MRVEKTVEFGEWLDGLRDLAGRARVLVRIERLIGGHPGDHRDLGGGIAELRVDVGPGYRVYYLRHGDLVLLLLAGGDKSTQPRDIAKAKRLARDYEGLEP